MIFQLPPTPPPAYAIVFVGTPISSDCARGSRDCFPKDRVGAAPEVAIALAPQPMWLVLAPLLPPEA
jgi:hypothetical protein